jgi:HNH endonuclease
MQSFSAEHILARSEGGKTNLANLSWACQGCNNHKYNKTRARDPVTGIMVALFHPRQQRWSDHFIWNEDGTLVLGLSPSGRATVEALLLNRKGLVNLRRILFAVNEHPPEEP